MLQGEIWEMYFDPVAGSEQSGRRPAVIVSGNLMNKYLGVVIVCPLTSNIRNYKGNVVLKPDPDNNLKKPSEILVFHIRSVSKKRLKNRLGTIKPEELKRLKQGLDDLMRY